MKKILIRADASHKMGTGHVMRCLALAMAARSRGWAPLMAVHSESLWVLERLKQEEISCQILPGLPPAAEKPDELKRQIDAYEPEAVVLDGYHFGPDCQKLLFGRLPLLVVDDYGHLPEYVADLLLNQNPGSETIDYKGEIGRKLLGPRFALLRPEFALARQKAKLRVWPEKPENILLSLGGGNFIEHLEMLAPGLSIPEMAGKTLKILAGSMEPEKIRAALANVTAATVEILTAVTDMPSLLLETDLCITAGGSTTWELCCLGAPFLTVEVAENQREIVNELNRLGLAPRFSAATLRLELDGAGVARRENIMKVTDGLGCDLVLDALTGVQLCT
ncbi:UDP-2,4-diacetamido-2,4,6-trideoxy-beta-L-altropyranose hydrolase [Deltaproteobacteria bacterium OttesenSCG-928-K17]|nr:UDP-2,4-diacetamido-2,4,6-trideoxy-beta-L-altropyranose hydrolase [Deltaproteobacteria bacterium OttesenSCG-928-K17]